MRTNQETCPFGSKCLGLSKFPFTAVFISKPSRMVTKWSQQIKYPVNSLSYVIFKTETVGVDRSFTVTNFKIKIMLMLITQ